MHVHYVVGLGIGLQYVPSKPSGPKYYFARTAHSAFDPHPLYNWINKKTNEKNIKSGRSGTREKENVTR